MLPELIQVSKADENPETRVRFVSVDTSNGNILQLRKENGMNISYIWGYNGIYPIAKIENATYASITASLITDAQNASNGTDEANLLLKLKALRNSLPNAMVTTYTYTPLVGISTVTDPKGYITTYKYDSFGRLKEVRDADNNLLSENQYNYGHNQQP